VSVPVPRYVAKLLPEHFVADELSLLVFGPGHGEAMVVILPDGSLGVVDGCREPPADPVRAFVAEWLQSYAGRRISFVALTHPHEDHYRGLGRLIQEFDGSIDRLWRTQMTGGRWGRSYIKHAEFCAQNADRVPIGDEFSGLERVIDAFRRRQDRRNILGENKTMLSLSFDGHELSVLSLAPSTNDVDLAQEDLLEVIRVGSRVRHDPNLTSAALLLTWGRARMLLGGDLVCAHGAYQGWDAAEKLLDGHVQVVKAPHHASRLALHPELTERMGALLTIVTPFREAALTQPPRPEQIRGLLEMPQSVALTSIPKWANGANGANVPCAIDMPPPRAQRRRERNSVLRIAPVLPATNNAVGVSLSADGTITRLNIAGNARLYQ